jgi:WhiB family transcriptional regulator, redox-sensing transcriptional regulator
VSGCLPDRPGDLTWQSAAACLGFRDLSGEDLFFPPDNPGGPRTGRGVPGEKARVEKAKAICADCPVIRQCLHYAVVNGCVGVWGGTTDGERKGMTHA